MPSCRMLFTLGYLMTLLASAWATDSHCSISYGNDSVPVGAPIATVKNGSYFGYSPQGYQQNVFVGIPFAQPPLGSLRFMNPQSLNSSWNNVKPATEYGPICMGQSVGSEYEYSEDCLYLNVVTPSLSGNDSLPVAVWIYGGGFRAGGPTDRTYNLTFFVEQSVKMGKPIIGVSISHRQGLWGFLNNNELSGLGQMNAGIRDQRLALHWIQENIHAFGGNPSKVTLWGESSGATSVGFHLTAFNGRDDKLFRAAIMESGGAVTWGALNDTAWHELLYREILTGVNCSESLQPLECFQRVPAQTIETIVEGSNGRYRSGFKPTLDGDLMARYGSVLLDEGAFAKVPILSGCNTDEGTSYPAYVHMDTIATMEAQMNITTDLQIGLPKAAVDQLLEAYSSNSQEYFSPSSATLGLGPNETLGEPYGRYYQQFHAYVGDVVYIAQRRRTCEAWARNGLQAWCYRFNAISATSTWPYGATHFQEVPFVFNNLKGEGYSINPFANRSQAYIDLSTIMSKTWINFVHDLDPNGWEGREQFDIPEWPIYTLDNPTNFVFEANVTSFLEPDTWRKRGIELINSFNKLLQV